MIKGFQKTSLIDYPGKICSVIFLSKCNFKCGYCITGDSNIFTDRGVYKIQDIVNNGINCKVYDLDGSFSKIKKCYKRNSRSILRVRVYLNSDVIRCTPDHKLFIFDSSQDRIVQKKSGKINIKTDYLVTPLPKKTILNQKLNTTPAIKNLYNDLATRKRFSDVKVINDIKKLRNQGFSWRKIYKKMGLTDHIRRVIEKNNYLDSKKVPLIKKEGNKVAIKGSNFFLKKHIDVTPDFLRLIGYYLSEGCSIKHKNRKNSYTTDFTLNKKEFELIEDIKMIFFNIFNDRLNTLNDIKCNTTHLYSKKGIIGLFLKYYFGSSVENKKIPTKFLFLEKELQKQLIIGLFRGDGISSNLYIKKYQKQRIHITSKTLLYQVSLILLRLGIKHSIFRKEIIISDKKIFEILGQNNLLTKKMIDTSRRYGFLDCNYNYLKIRDIKNERCAEVYNLEINNKSHSYNVNLNSISNCHNPELVLNKDLPKIKKEEVLKALEERKKFINGVTITGGEPTLHKDLPGLIKEIKEKKLLVKLDTNGTNPKMLNFIIKNKLIDFIAMDIKNVFEKYGETVNSKVDHIKLGESIKIIRESGIEHEFRTTTLPRLHKKEDLVKIAKELQGAKKYVLQQFIPAEKILDKKFLTEKKYSQEELEGIRKECNKYVKTEIRNI